ncbi:MAG: hypothetical protein Q9191_007182 [Dirinaria sp. TL-2023a]
MATTKPVAVVIPGGWHPSTAYTPLTSALTDAGFEFSVASLPSFNTNEPSSASCAADAIALRRHILSHIDEAGHGVVLLVHSYGGIPASGASYGLSKKARETQGRKTAVLGMIYMCAFVVPEGQSLVEYLGGSHPPYLLRDSPSFGLSTIDNPKAVLFNDVPSSLATELAASLQPHAVLAFETPAPATSWKEPEYAGKLVFIKCMIDQALPSFLQDMFIEKSGVQWTVKEVDAGHSAWASRPDEIVNELQSLLLKFNE